MRNKELFRAYVYEKAAIQKRFDKKNRSVWMRSIAACSLIVMVFGVWVYAELSDKSAVAESAATLESLNAAARVENYGAVLGAATEEAAEAENILDYALLYLADDAGTDVSVQSKMYSLTTESSIYTVAESPSEYDEELQNIDFEKYVAIVFESPYKGHTIRCTDTTVTVILETADEFCSEESSYTVLLERSLYAGKSISVEIQ